jgi:hypothetical protein
MKIGRSMSFVEAREAKVQAATVDEVNMALRKYISRSTGWCRSMRAISPMRK